jgi:hypothetical protein
MRLSDKNYRVPQAVCPWCGKKSDAASGVDTDDAPKVGSFTICIDCASVSTFGIGLVLVRCPDSVWQAAEEPIPEMLRTMRRAIIANNSHNEP